MAFKICTVGCGKHACRVHGWAYKKYCRLNEDTRLVACCDVDIAKAEEFRTRFGFEKAYSDLERMLDVEKPDAVCLVVGEAQIAPLSVMIMGKGYPLIMEKPPGLNIDQTREMIAAAQKMNVANQVAFNRRNAPLTRKLLELLRADLPHPGQIFDIQHNFTRVDRYDDDFSATAIHGIDLVRYIAGSDYQAVRIRYQRFPHINPNAANIYMDCLLKSGAAAQINFLPFCGATMERVVVHGYGRSYFLDLPTLWRINDVQGKLTVYTNNESTTVYEGYNFSDGGDIFESNGFYYENASFFDCIRNGRTPEHTLETAVQSVILAQCIREGVTEKTF
jgi:myo-inositol 2-dehydrogenase/D-chiro-inositol 1-dehydrogenase